MSFHKVDFTLSNSNRADQRKQLISVMLDEQPGQGNGDSASRYQYNVERYLAYAIYLKRPTQLNKGFDFTVNVKGLDFKKQRIYHNPSHNDIFKALQSCREVMPDKYPLIKDAINKIYNCQNVDYSEYDSITFKDYNDTKHPIAIILMAIKWLFMEQDCAYWNYSGRKMFYDALKERDLA